MWKENHQPKTLESKIFLFFFSRFRQSIMSNVNEIVRCSDREIYFHQIKARWPLNATKIVGFFKTYEF